MDREQATNQNPFFNQSGWQASEPSGWPSEEQAAKPQPSLSESGFTGTSWGVDSQTQEAPSYMSGISGSGWGTEGSQSSPVSSFSGFSGTGWSASDFTQEKPSFGDSTGGFEWGSRESKSSYGQNGKSVFSASGFDAVEDHGWGAVKASNEYNEASDSQFGSNDVQDAYKDTEWGSHSDYDRGGFQGYASDAPSGQPEEKAFEKIPVSMDFGPSILSDGDIQVRSSSISPERLEELLQGVRSGKYVME
ncbi:MAG: hypothetical protein IJU50_08350, partial [Lachnospiraceae bacterium]|nr:hypothetical protein [Lachnospiraceae bacterium]